MSRHTNLDPLSRDLPQDENQWNALEAVFYDRPDILKRHLESKVDLTATYVGGTKMVYMAAFKGHAECLRLLMAVGEDFATTDREGWTPVTSASAKGHAECLKILVDAGASVSHVDTTGRTPANLAAFLNHPECLQILSDAGADITTPDRRGITPMQAATGGKTGHKDACHRILKDALQERSRLAASHSDPEIEPEAPAPH